MKEIIDFLTQSVGAVVVFSLLICMVIILSANAKKFLHAMANLIVVIEPYEADKPILRPKEDTNNFDTSFMAKPVKKLNTTSTQLCRKCGSPYIKADTCGNCGHEH